MRFEWDREKAKKNLRKHRVSFDEAMMVFYVRKEKGRFYLLTRSSVI